jgi:hypothetical protein
MGRPAVLPGVDASAVGGGVPLAVAATLIHWPAGRRGRTASRLASHPDDPKGSAADDKKTTPTPTAKDDKDTHRPGR